MENTRNHVAASGNSTLRGFFSSANVDYDPPSKSLRQNIKKAKAKRVYDLASGATNDAEEDEIRDIMSLSENSYEVVRFFGTIDGWSGLDDELPEGHLDQISRNLAQVLDQRDYVVYQKIRRYLALLDYAAGPTLGDCFTRILQLPTVFQAPEIDALLADKAGLLKTVTSATMRERTNMVNAARIHPTVINQYLAVAPHRSDELVSLMFELNYTTRICTELAVLNYQPLYGVITDMVDPGLSNRQRIAARDTCLRLSLEFAAARRCVDSVGSNQAKSTVNRFTTALKAALDNFPATVPAPTAVGAIAAALGSVASTLADLQTTIQNLPDALAGAITLPDLLGSGDDDRARTLISELHTQGSLAHTSFGIKLKLVNALLSGFTVDDDELAILRVMETAKAYDQAELYQLTSAATWDSLYTSFDGDEYDALEGLLNMPT